MKNNNHLLKPNTVYGIHLNNQFMIIDSKKYRFKLDTTGWNNMDRDGDVITTTECFGDNGVWLVVRYPITSVVSLVKQLTVLEEVVEGDFDGDKDRASKSYIDPRCAVGNDIQDLLYLQKDS